jgi:hypothetical protein
MPITLPERRMLTAQQAADYCGFESVEGFKAHIRVAPIKQPGWVRYDRLDLDEYLDSLRAPVPKHRSIAELAGNGDGARRGG